MRKPLFTPLFKSRWVGVTPAPFLITSFMKIGEVWGSEKSQPEPGQTPSKPAQPQGISSIVAENNGTMAIGFAIIMCCQKNKLHTPRNAGGIVVSVRAYQFYQIKMLCWKAAHTSVG